LHNRMVMDVTKEEEEEEEEEELRFQGWAWRE
jgi:hypothetical protein